MQFAAFSVADINGLEKFARLKAQLSEGSKINENVEFTRGEGAFAKICFDHSPRCTA